MKGGEHTVGSWQCGRAVRGQVLHVGKGKKQGGAHLDMVGGRVKEGTFTKLRRACGEGCVDEVARSISWKLVISWDTCHIL